MKKMISPMEWIHEVLLPSAVVLLAISRAPTSVTGKLIKPRCLTKLPVLQSVINRVAHFAKNTPTVNNFDLFFEDCHHCPYNWSDDYDILGLDGTPMAPYPDIPAKIPGVQLDCQHHPSSPLPSLFNDDPDWAQFADNAIANADLNHADLLPHPPG